MKIDRIELYHVAMPLIEPWRTAYGEDADIHSVLCRMVSGSVDAWGESSPLAAPCYSPEWGGGLFSAAEKWLAPALIGKEISSGEALQQELSLFKGNQFAKAVLDNAWWALSSKLENCPLHQLLGATRDSVPVGADFGVGDSVDDLLAQIDKAVKQQFPRIKLKFRPGWDIPMLQSVRSSFPNQVFHIDCNSGYRLQDVDLFKQVDEFQLAMIEQPLQHDDLIDHTKLAKLVTTPICLDESITSPLRAQQAVDHQSCQYINVKPGRVGGLTNALAIHNLAASAGIPCWVGGMLESAVGSAHCVALAMLDNFTYPADIFPTARFYHEDLADRPLCLTESADCSPQVTVFPTLPEPVPERLHSLCLQSVTITK